MPHLGMGPTLRRYFLREVAVPFLLGIGVFTFILLIARMLKLVELVVNRAVPIFEIVKLFTLRWPFPKCYPVAFVINTFAVDKLDPHLRPRRRVGQILGAEWNNVILDEVLAVAKLQQSFESCFLLCCIQNIFVFIAES